MILNSTKVKEVGGCFTVVISKDKQSCMAATVPADGFDRLVGYGNDSGEWLWVHKDFRK